MTVREEDISGLLAKEELRKIREEKMLDQMGQVNTKLGEIGGQVKSICELYPELCQEIKKASKPEQVLPPGYLNEKEHQKMWDLIKECPECLDGHTDKDGIKRKGLRTMLLQDTTKEQLKKIGMEDPEILEKFDVVCKDGECKPVLRDYKKKAEKKLF
jgi:hypothetical protein